MSEFIYEKKETYSQEDVDKLIEQNSGFVSKGFKGFVSQEDHKKLVEELKPFKLSARNTHIKSLVKDLTSEDKLGDTISLSKITEEDDDDTIKSKIQETIKSRPWLQRDAGTPPEIKKQTKKPVIKKEPKKYRFI